MSFSNFSFSRRFSRSARVALLCGFVIVSSHAIAAPVVSGRTNSEPKEIRSFDIYSVCDFIYARLYEGTVLLNENPMQTRDAGNTGSAGSETLKIFSDKGMNISFLTKGRTIYINELAIQSQRLNDKEKKKTYLGNRFGIHKWPNVPKIRLGCDAYSLTIASSGDVVENILISTNFSD